MQEFCEIHWTTDSLDEARKVARYLVQERLVACAQITPWIESVYMWDNQLETAQESRIILKTRVNLFERIKQVILDNTSYEVPEVTMLPIAAGHQEYLKWIEESTPAVAASS